MTPLFDEIVVTLSAYPALSLLVKGTVVLAFALTGAWLARKSRASARHALLASAFSVLLALPVVSFIARPVPISVPVATADGIVAPLFDAAPVSSSGVSADIRPDASRAESTLSLPPLSTMLLYGWFIGSLFFFIPIVRGLLQVRTLRRYGLPWRQGQSIADELASGASRRVDVQLHEALSGPMTCGFLRPAVILPVDAQCWTEQDLERALVHELEHVRRCDWAVHCLARVACAAYWFHPLVWFAWRRLALEAERSCDDAVLRGSEATAYADQLVGLARRRRLQGAERSPVLAMANRSDLAARIGALLDRSQARGRAGAFLVAASCIAATAIILTMSPLRMVAAPQSNTPTAQNIPKWDAVSVKRCASTAPAPVEGQGAGANRSPDRITVTCVTLERLALAAWAPLTDGQMDRYKTASLRLEGFPEWTKSERYSIEAKAQGSPGQPMMGGPMMQALLEDRFHLKVREETREGKVFTLSVAKGGPKMEILKPGGCVPLTLKPNASPDNRCPYVQQKDGNMGFDAWMNMDSLVTLLTVGAQNPQSPLDAPILNKTGLTGAYHVRVEYTPATPAADAPPAPTIFTAIQELGLKLEAGKGPRQYLVFDHAERPSEN